MYHSVEIFIEVFYNDKLFCAKKKYKREDFEGCLHFVCSETFFSLAVSYLMLFEAAEVTRLF
jgi:hypothetical protein